jgi:hypothetical protein
MHPHPSLPGVLLTAVYALAIAVAVANPGPPTVGGLVVLAGLTARWIVRHRHRAPVAVPAPAPA